MLATSMRAFAIYDKLRAECGLMDKEAAFLLDVSPPSYVRLKTNLKEGVGGLNEATDKRLQIAIVFLARSWQKGRLPLSDKVLKDVRQDVIYEMFAEVRDSLPPLAPYIHGISKAHLIRLAAIFTATY